MPTGYTAPIVEDNIDFKEYALGCARAFGAGFDQREDPMGPIKLIEESSYRKKQVDRDRAELERLKSEDFETFKTNYIEEAKESFVKSHLHYQRKVKEYDSYMDMLTKVEAWTPPTSEHAGLKKFMEDQLHDTLKFDFSDFDESQRQYASMNVEDFVSQYFKTPSDFAIREAQKQAIADAETNLEYSLNFLKKEQDSVASKNAWITALYESVN